MNAPLSIFTAARALKETAKRKPLKGEELEKFKELCKFLKKCGLSNGLIARLTDGMYGEVTIKQYTRGVRSQSTPEMEEIVDAIADMNSTGGTLEDVKLCSELALIAGGRGKLVELVHAIVSARNSGIDFAKDTAAILLLMKNKLTPQLVEELLTLRSHLREKEQMKKETHELKTKCDMAREELTFLDDLRKLGFNKSVLQIISEDANKWGGLEQYLLALKKFLSLKVLEEKVGELEKRKGSLEAEVKQLNADHSHLQTLIGMCNKLLFELKFTVKTIEDIYRLAKMCGEPAEVLSFLSKYKEVKQIEDNIKELEQKKKEIEESIKQLEESAQNAKAFQISLDERIVRDTQHFAAAIMAHYVQAVSTITNAFNSGVAELKKVEQEYAQKRAEMEAMADELKLAQVFNAIYKYPENVKDLSEEHGIMMIEAGSRFLFEKGTDVKLSFPPKVTQKHPRLVHLEGTSLRALLAVILSALRPSAVLEKI